MKVKNAKLQADTWVGQEIQPGEYYTLEAFELSRWQTNSKVINSISTGELIMNDNESDISSTAEALNYLLQKDTSPKDSDGSPLQRIKVTTAGWSYQLHGVEFKTSQLNSVNDKKVDGTDYGYATIKCYDVNNIELTTQQECDTSAVKTVVDWEPNHDYEAVGGFFKLASTPLLDMILWVIGVPDVSAQYGGSKEFVSNINLKYIGMEEGIRADGRAPKYMPYDAINHTNKMRLVLKHEPGFKHNCLMIFEIFKP